ncbi:ATP-binding protein [Streptomyces sp. CA-179760]|uniref:ATP-binding protein n=1 Tax=Streptomyces sp. CA-179760 TaxID=3240054 RepID=UPI003D8ECFC1
MSSPAQHVLRPPSGAAAHASTTPMPETRPQPSGAQPSSTAPQIRSLDHFREDSALVVTELAADAATHAAPRTPDASEVRFGFRLNPTHPLVTVSDPDDRSPVHAPAAGSAVEEHGRGLRIVDALSEEWGWTPVPRAGKTVRARSSTRPPI